MRCRSRICRLSFLPDSRCPSRFRTIHRYSSIRVLDWNIRSSSARPAAWNSPVRRCSMLHRTGSIRSLSRPSRRISGYSERNSTCWPMPSVVNLPPRWSRDKYRWQTALILMSESPCIRTMSSHSLTGACIKNVPKILQNSAGRKG